MAENMDESARNTAFEDTEDAIHFQKVINVYRCYKMHACHRLNRTVQYLTSLPTSHQQKLSKYRLHLELVRRCVDANDNLMQQIVGDVCHMFENIEYGVSKHKNARLAIRPTDSDIEKTHSVLKQIVREWSADGAIERSACFQPILDEIDEKFGRRDKRSDVRILVPGAGLGRLAYDIALQGYTCQGNEYSLIMLFASNFILNKCKGSYLFTIYPWLHQYHNNLFASDQIRSVTIPDADPSAIPDGVDFSMAAGNFLDVYTELNRWDCVATCFFIDTSRNILSYVETIWKILKPGGFWINLGPLLYHYADIMHENSIEPSYDILREAILDFGFEMIKEETDVECHYTSNARAMLSYEYKSVFFVCLKPI